MKYFVDKHNLIFMFKISVLVICGFVLSRFYFWPSLFITILFLVFFIYQYINLKEQSIADTLKHLKAINQGQESLNIEAYQEGEISKLATELNKTTIKMATMNQLLSTQTVNMKKGLEDIAHQLKTPLSSLLLLNELQNQDEISLRSRDQLLRMDYLIGSLLKLIKLEAQLEAFALQECKLKEIVEDSIKMIRPLNDKLIINTNVSDELCLCDFNKTREAIVNVLNNKLRYAKGEITIVSYCKDLCLYLEISDDGEAIDGPLREKVFERFYSGFNRDSKSIGIGLSIAHEIMKNQKGKLSLIKDNTFQFQFNRI